MILFKIPYFQRLALKYAFSHQSKPKGFDGMKQVFVDSDKKRYYKYDNDLDTPFQRLSALQVAIMELQSGIAIKEMPIFLDAMDNALQSLLPQAKGQVSGASKIGFIIQEMRWRMDHLIHEDLLFKLAACVYIREDEQPEKVDPEIEQEKITQFKKDAQEGGLYDFFFSSPLRAHLPYANITEEEFSEYLTVSNQKIKAMKMMIEGFTSDQQSLKG